MVLILPALLIALGGCAAHRPQLEVASPYRDPSTLEKGQILHLATGKILSEQQLLEYLSCYRVIYVGETHDSIDDHAVEFFVLKGLHEKHPGNLALGLEMLPRDVQADLDAYVRGEMDEGAFRQLWIRHWGHTFAYYEQILRYARENRIKVLALNVEDDLREAVRSKPVAEIEPDLAERLPEMDLEDPYHKAVTQAVFSAHHMGPQDREAFYRVQVLWDETMAQTAAEYLESPEGRRKQLVVLTGGNHVRYGYGIPRRLFRRLPVPYVIVLPFAVEIPENKKDRMMDVEEPTLPMPPADVVWAVGYTDMEDLKKAP
jgi:uncharacterized iron-regulated protein